MREATWDLGQDRTHDKYSWDRHGSIRLPFFGGLPMFGFSPDPVLENMPG